jgi:molybdopterin-biosynthesis enzyme MoeA-like protein
MTPFYTISVIGDEILKGQVHDTNSHFIAERLYKLGLKVGRVSSKEYTLVMFYIIFCK